MTAGSGWEPRPPRRRGRPSAAERAEGGLGARDRILASARAAFAEHGFDRTTVRGIARGAGVDPALVHHYFGTKEQVFAAAVEDSFQPVLRDLERLPGAAPELLGERLVRFLLAVWEDPVARQPVLAVVRSAVNSETAADVFREQVVRRLVRRLTRELRVPDPELRAELATAQLVGTAVLRYVVRVEPLASADPEQLVRRLAPVVQHHLTGEGGGVVAADDAPGAGV